MTNGHPSIFQIGKVRDDGITIAITGWGLGLCLAMCDCHRHPTGGHLAISQDQQVGRIGLVSFASETCDCCEPWTATELAAILIDFADIKSIPTHVAETDGELA